MTSDDPKPSQKQSSHGNQAPNIAAGGDVNIHYGKSEDEKGAEQQNANKFQQSTAVKVALIGAAATILVAMIGMATQCSEDSEPIPPTPSTSSIEINAPVTNTGGGNQAISGGDTNITIEEKPK